MVRIPDNSTLAGAMLRATLAWLALALCLMTWDLLWLGVERTGLIEPGSIAGPAGKWGTIPTWAAGQPWADLFENTSPNVIVEELPAFAGITLNAAILGAIFGLTMYAGAGRTPLAWILNAVFALSALPAFCILLFLNIDAMSTLAPSLVGAAAGGKGRGGALLGFVVSCPLPVLICAGYYLVFRRGMKFIEDGDRVRRDR